MSLSLLGSSGSGVNPNFVLVFALLQYKPEYLRFSEGPQISISLLIHCQVIYVIVATPHTCFLLSSKENFISRMAKKLTNKNSVSVAAVVFSLEGSSVTALNFCVLNYVLRKDQES